MSTLTREKLAKIFDSGEMDIVSRTKKLKEQETLLQAAEAKIKQLESEITKKKPARKKKDLSDEEKQAIKDRLALGRKKKAELKQQSTFSTESNVDINFLLNEIEKLKAIKHSAESSKETNNSESASKPKETNNSESSSKLKEINNSESASKPKETVISNPAQSEEPKPDFSKYYSFLKKSYKPKYY